MSWWPREAAICRFELDSPSVDGSGLWRSLGCDFSIRWTRRASPIRIARRRRIDGSILEEGVGQLGDCRIGLFGGGGRDQTHMTADGISLCVDSV